nr:MAG TPA: hypothetical protein [Caudoviricetes sp.]
MIFHCSPLEMQKLPITEIIRQIESGNKVIHEIKKG